MIRAVWIFALSFVGVFIVDQNIKNLFLDGYIYDSSCITFALTLNKGVAFSMLSSLGKDLKYIQIALVIAVVAYLFYKKDIFVKYSLPLGLLFGGGCSNIYDRFIHGGVVDYVYWHCGFDFAIFNFADVVIDISVAIIFFLSYLKREKTSSD